MHHQPRRKFADSLCALAVGISLALGGCRWVLDIQDAELAWDAGSEVDVFTNADTGSDADRDDREVRVSADPVERVEAACARITACNQGSGAPDLRACVRDHLLATLADVSGHPLRAPLWACLDDATSCIAIDSCLKGASAPGACSASGSARICIGATAVTCAGGTYAGAEACELSGRSCLALSSTEAVCVGGGTCAATAPPVCNGSNLMNCEGTLDRGVRCDALGGICVSNDAGAGCAGEDPLCASKGTACDGNVSLICRQGHVARIDCAWLLRTCTPLAAGDPSDEARGCVPGSAECTDDDTPACDGARVRYCLGGRRRTIDCDALGLGPCKTVASASGTSAACSRT